MAAGIEENPGNVAGRVTITTTLMSLLPPFAAIAVVVGCAMLGILDKETAGAVVLGILATAGLTTSTVFTTAKRTPTDQAKVIWGSAPVSDVVTPVPTGEVVAGEVLATEPEVDNASIRTGAHAATLADELAQVRKGGAL